MFFCFSLNTLQPLTSAHGKKVVAKELGLWEGSDGYYSVGDATSDAPHSRMQYLVYEGVLSTNTGYRFHSQKAVDAVLLHLAAIAFVTGAVL